ncbi:flagellar brake protein [Trinickia sp.]|uniref:flagellar brake protein n=1 Tax=Trinickia sp. TaxID=2571163 RepID=UPI003F801BA8
MSDVQHTELVDPTQLPVGEPLAWPVLDKDGRLLLRAGAVIATQQEREFLLKHFSFYAGALNLAAPVKADSDDVQSERLKSVDMRLSIGSPLGLRGLLATSGPMRRSRLIGSSPDRALFVTSPGAGRLPLALTPGENLQVVAIGAHAVFQFACTVLAVCNQPLEYLVLSAPSGIRLLRERTAARVHTRLAVRYRTLEADTESEGLGLGRDLSVQGMSLMSARPVSQVGTHVQVSFPISTALVDTQFEARAVVRNVKESADVDGSLAYGLEFETVSAEQQFALRSFLFDCFSASAL